MQKAAAEFLAFRLGEEEYAIDILKVQEIRGYEPATRIAQAPAYLKGVMNLRGAIVPIVDLRLRFSLGHADYTPFTVVIILNVAGRVVGVVVDSVSDVVSLAPEAIKPPPFPAAPDSNAIVGLGTLGDRMLILLDIERLVAASAIHDSQGEPQAHG